MLRKAIAAAISVCVLGGAVLAATNIFTDVADDHPHKDDIVWTVDEGLFLGYDDGTFRPDHELTDH